MDLIDNNLLLQPEYFHKVLDNIQMDSEQYALTNDVPFVTVNSRTITMDVRQMMGGMTRAVAEGSESPLVEKRGVQQIHATPAHWREKVTLGEKDLNMIRKLGTSAEVEQAAAKVAEIVGQLRYRLETRMEWTKWQMMYGSLAISQEDAQFTITYPIPSHYLPTLSGADLWSAASTADPISNITDWLDFYLDEGSDPAYFQYNSKVFNMLVNVDSIKATRDSLFSGQNKPAMLSRENINLIFDHYFGLNAQMYNKGYYLIATVTSAITNVSTTFTVDDASGMAIDDVIVVTHKNGFADGQARIPITNVTGNTITHAAIGGSTTYPIGSEGRCKKRFLEDDKFVIRGSLPPGTTGGQNFAEFVSTPHVYGPGGVVAPVPGIIMKTLNKSEDDPPRVEIISGVSGLPVLYHPTVNLAATVA